MKAKKKKKQDYCQLCKGKIIGKGCVEFCSKACLKENIIRKSIEEYKNKKKTFPKRLESWNKCCVCKETLPISRRIGNIKTCSKNCSKKAISIYQLKKYHLNKVNKDIRVCVICQNRFKSRHCRKITCSQPCSLKNKRHLQTRWSREEYRKNKAKKPHSYSDKECKQCGNLLTKEKAKTTAKYCSYDCAREVHSKNFKERKKKKLREEHPERFICEICHKTIPCDVKRRKVCSEICKNKRVSKRAKKNYRKNKSYFKQYYQENKERVWNKPTIRNPELNICKVCKKPVPPERQIRNTRTCSLKCSAKNQKAIINKASKRHKAKYSDRYKEQARIRYMENKTNSIHKIY